MRLEAKKYLYDIDQAAGLIADFTKGKRFTDYQSDALLRSAVERQFGVIGEALAQLARLDDALAGRVASTTESSPFGTFSYTGMRTWTIAGVCTAALGFTPGEAGS